MKFKELFRVFRRKKEPKAPPRETEWFGWPDAPPGPNISWPESMPEASASWPGAPDYSGAAGWPAAPEDSGAAGWPAAPEDAGAAGWPAAPEDGGAAGWPAAEAPEASDASGASETWPIEWPMGSNAPISPEARPPEAPKAADASGGSETWPIEWPMGSDAPISPEARPPEAPKAADASGGSETWPIEWPKGSDAPVSPEARPPETPEAADARGSPETWPAEMPEAADAPGGLEAWPTEVPEAASAPGSLEEWPEGTPETSGASGNPEAWPVAGEADDGETGKKKKAKKAKKAKKEKKEKKPKKRKRKKGEGEEGEEEGKKKKFPILLILFPAAVLLGAATALLILRPWADKTPPPEEGPELVEPVGPEQNGDGEQTGDSDADPSQTDSAPNEGEPFRPGSNNPTMPHEAVDTAQAMDQFGRFDPESLELEGESMAEYHYYATGKTLEVDGIKCREIMVYRQDEATGTNDIAGRYFLSMDASRLFRDMGDRTVVELSPAFVGIGG